MTWEQLPRRSSSRRWAAVTAAIAAIVLVVIAVTGREGLGARSAETIPVGTNLPAPRESAASVPPVDPTNFEPRPLRPVEVWTRPRVGTALLPDAPELAIVATDHLGVWIADVPTGHVERLRLPQGGIPATAGGLWLSAHDIVFDTTSTVLRLSDGERGLETFATGHRLIATVDSEAVWVFDERGRRSGGTASRVSLDGDVLQQVSIPAVATPLVGTSSHLLVDASGAISRIADDGTRSLIARGEAVASNGAQLAWLQCGGDLSCAVVLGTVDAPDGVRVALEPGRRPLAGLSGRPVAEFSPDGRWLALPLFDASATGDQAMITVALIDVATGVEIHRAAGARANPFESPLAWSPDSRWLIFASDSGIDAWRAGSRETTTLDLGFSVARDLAVRSAAR